MKASKVLLNNFYDITIKQIHFSSRFCFSIEFSSGAEILPKTFYLLLHSIKRKDWFLIEISVNSNFNFEFIMLTLQRIFSFHEIPEVRWYQCCMVIWFNTLMLSLVPSCQKMLTHSFLYFHNFLLSFMFLSYLGYLLLGGGDSVVIQSETSLAIYLDSSFLTILKTIFILDVLMNPGSDIHS